MFVILLRRALVPGAFFLLAGLQAWPLPMHLGTRLTGPPTGDTGVYVWNTWVFRHELTDGGRLPLYTSAVLPLDGPTDLSLHNYTAFADVLAFPLQPLFGVVAAFNLVYLLNAALAGWGVFLLVRRATGRSAEALLAGVAFAWTPYLVARSTAHFSLAAAAPLPFFVYWFDRAWDSQRLRDAVMVGVCFAWAMASDPYYAVYCLMLGGALSLSRILHVTRARDVATGRRHGRRLLDGALVALVALMLIVHGFGGGSIRVGSVVVSMRTLYTPMLVFAALFLARVLLTVRWRMHWLPVPVWPATRSAAAMAATASVLLAPVLWALTARAADSQMVRAPVFWRSSAPGADLLGFLLPNPGHPFAPASWAAWLATQPGGYVDQVASISWVALAVVLGAWAITGHRPRRLWVWITVGFGLLALGPFLRIAGVDTAIPTPWTLLRYAPVIGDARMPSRFAIVSALGLAVLFGGALAALTARFPARRRLLVAGIGALLVFELLPAPRALYAARIPAIYDTVAADPRPVRILELPFGIRDGLSSLGDFSAGSQFYQTRHGKALLGGYLSRVTVRSKAFHQRMPVLDALMTLSEGRVLTSHQRAHALEAADDLVTRANLGYVVIDRTRMAPAFIDFAIDLFDLVKVDADGAYELYVPTITGTTGTAGTQSTPGPR